MSTRTRMEPAEPDPLANEEELIMHLESDQLVAETARPVAPAQLGRRAVVGLWCLRVFAILVSAMVIYTFIARLH
jgi:hypothetical protein